MVEACVPSNGLDTADVTFAPIWLKNTLVTSFSLKQHRMGTGEANQSLVSASSWSKVTFAWIFHYINDRFRTGLHFVNGKLQPPAIVLQNAINQSYKNNGIKSKLKKAFQRTAHPSNWNSGQRVNSFSLVTQLTSAALCVSSPVLPNSSKVSPVVKSLIRPFVIPRIEITPDSDLSPETSSIDSDSKDLSDVPKPRRKSSYFVRLRKKSFIWYSRRDHAKPDFWYSNRIVCLKRVKGGWRQYWKGISNEGLLLWCSLMILKVPLIGIRS